MASKWESSVSSRSRLAAAAAALMALAWSISAALRAFQFADLFAHG